MEPIRDNNRDKTNNAVMLVSPIGGWNAKDSLASMPETDAVVMDNWMPHEGYVSLRQGYRKVVDSKVGDTTFQIKTIMPYNVSGQEHLLLAGNHNFYVIDKVTVPPTLTSKLNGSAPTGNDKWNYTLYRETLVITKAGQTPKYYNGVSVQDAEYTITPILPNPQPTPIQPTPEHEVSTELDQVVLYRNRLFFSYKDKLWIVYAKVAGSVPAYVGGTNVVDLGFIDMSMFCKRGGSIAILANWTKTGAEDLNNMLIAITTEGEVLAFSGDDPADATRWALKGVYNIPQVLPGSNVISVGGDLVIITVAGYFSLSDLLNANFVNEDSALSNKINKVVKDLTHKYNDFPYWTLCYAPRYDILLVNTATFRDSDQYILSDQHVLNLSTGAWSRFTGLDAACFETFKGDVYFASIDKNGGLYKMFEGSTDGSSLNGTSVVDGRYISGYVQQAYSNFNLPKIKSFKMAKFIASNGLGVEIGVNFNVDFVRSNAVAKNSIVETSANWKDTKWNTRPWEYGAVTSIVSSIINAVPGYYGSIGLSVNTKYSNIEWYSTLIILAVEK
ncbi:hypothetical protein AGMMS49995_10900 [Endomicrobiia bacterium]|nr:hypothetical protein AGMMS49995_10900 [Endomicrobiia bacterium]